MSLVSDEDLHKLKDLSIFIVHVRSSVSKSWRLLDSLEKKLIELTKED